MPQLTSPSGGEVGPQGRVRGPFSSRARARTLAALRPSPQQHPNPRPEESLHLSPPFPAGVFSRCLLHSGARDERTAADAGSLGSRPLAAGDVSTRAGPAWQAALLPHLPWPKSSGGSGEATAFFTAVHPRGLSLAGPRSSPENLDGASQSGAFGYASFIGYKAFFISQLIERPGFSIRRATAG